MAQTVRSSCLQEMRCVQYQSTGSWAYYLYNRLIWLSNLQVKYVTSISNALSLSIWIVLFATQILSQNKIHWMHLIKKIENKNKKIEFQMHLVRFGFTQFDCDNNNNKEKRTIQFNSIHSIVPRVVPVIAFYYQCASLISRH